MYQIINQRFFYGLYYIVSEKKNVDTEWGLGIILNYILAKTICRKGWVQEGHKVGGIAT